MAIGDTWTQLMGTATTDRQPASGVAEQLSYMVKTSSTDTLSMYNGAVAISILDAGVRTSGPYDSTAANTRQPIYNMAIVIDNTNYLRKGGTTDQVYVGGVQIDV